MATESFESVLGEGSGSEEIGVRGQGPSSSRFVVADGRNREASLSESAQKTHL